MTNLASTPGAFAAPAGLWAEVEASPRAESLDALLEEAVAKFGERTFAEFFELGVSLTFTELASLVDRLANVLSRLGVAAGDHVGMLLPNVPLYPAAFLALARLGAAYVPINRRLTGAEVSHVCREADVSFLIVHADLRDALETSEVAAALAGDRIALTGLGEGDGDGAADLDALLARAEEGADYPRHDHGPEDLVSILFTSGSTGLPKGCMHTPEYWLVLAQSFNPLGSRDERFLLDGPFSYMTGPSATVNALTGGGTVVIASKPTLKNFVKRLRDLKIGFAWFPEVLVRSPAKDDDADHPLRRAWIESMPKEAYAAVEDRFGIRCRPCFAMTEIGMGTLVPWDDDGVDSTCIGIPGPFRECKVIDQEGNPAADGAIGELCVRGPGIFRGYYKRDEVNAAEFLEGGWFRTGDLVHREEGGRFHYVGRAKAMVRRGAEQISAQEVEMALRAMPEIVEAAVVPVPDDFYDEEVKVYVILANGLTAAEVAPERIEAWSRERLAAYKVPRYIEYRQELPRTQSEKVSKPDLLKEKDDLRCDSHDRVDGVWR